MSGILIGGVEIIWSLAIEFTQSAIGRALDSLGVGGVFFWSLLAVGVSCMCGSIFKCRKVRMAGLSASPFLLLPCSFFLMLEGVVNAGTLLMPWIAFMSVLVLLRDSTRKTRNEPMGN